MAPVYYWIGTMQPQLQFLSQLQTLSRDTFQRSGIVIYGTADWQNALIHHFHQNQQSSAWFSVGDWALEGVHSVTAKQGALLLGRECEVLLYDAREAFDANSFTAALGTLVGGGLLIVVADKQNKVDFAQQWLHVQWQKLTVIEQGQPLPTLPMMVKAPKHDQFGEQNHAVSLIEKVISGHRKRPLVLTADRGRGKTSALGIACAKLLEQKALRILITAPSIKAVEPVYQHAMQRLDEAIRVKKDRLELGQGYIQFVAPDDLLSNLTECDLLLVDEAAAIPVPMLKQITEHYHRLVFSSTVHGYEGCGRGFSLKFVKWLQENRPGMSCYHLQQPIRWSQCDPLEAWVYAAFILDAELTDILPLQMAPQLLVKLNKSELVSQPDLLRTCFSLLVNAHYQTSPNDLLHLLQDGCCEIFVAKCGSQIVGVVLTVEEGGLEDQLIKDIQLGKRRPKGHLAPVTIINQLGFAQVGALATLRIMRIAIHPELQGKGIGSQMLEQLAQSAAAHISYLSTSFGASEELIYFWRQCEFQAIRLGTSRDAASGCYSLLMTRELDRGDKGTQLTSWIEQSQALFRELLANSIAHTYPKLEPQLIRVLLEFPLYSEPFAAAKQSLIENYALGGNSFESVSLWLQQWLLQQGLLEVSDLMISKLFLQQDWAVCAMQYGLPGRKQVEMHLRQELQYLLDKFTV